MRILLMGLQTIWQLFRKAAHVFCVTSPLHLLTFIQDNETTSGCCSNANTSFTCSRKELEEAICLLFKKWANCSVSVTWYIILQWKWMLHCYTHMHTHTKTHKQREQKYYSVSKYNKITILSKRLQRKGVDAA